MELYLVNMGLLSTFTMWLELSQFCLQNLSEFLLLCKESCVIITTTQILENVNTSIVLGQQWVTVAVIYWPFQIFLDEERYK